MEINDSGFEHRSSLSGSIVQLYLGSNWYYVIRWPLILGLEADVSGLIENGSTMATDAEIIK